MACGHRSIFSPDRLELVFHTNVLNPRGWSSSKLIDVLVADFAVICVCSLLALVSCTGDPSYYTDLEAKTKMRWC